MNIIPNTQTLMGYTIFKLSQMIDNMDAKLKNVEVKVQALNAK